MLIHPVVHVTQAPAVQAQGVSIRYNGRQALEAVSFQLEAGQRVAVLGPNGAGKTTLLKALAGMLRPNAGRVSVFGESPGGHICIAYVPQRSQIDWAFPVTVAEVVMMGRIRQIGVLRWPRARDWDIVRQALAGVEMTEFSDRQIGELSGGQQQRAFLAQALAQQAEIILMDEPLTALDLPSQEAIFRAIDRLAGSGVTVVLSTHDLNLAAERFDQVLLLNRALIAIGPPAAVFTPENLRRAYGSHIHRLAEGEGLMVLTDTCCEGDEAGG
jgi:manganese/iron transport system ATP-binding protein